MLAAASHTLPELAQIQGGDLVAQAMLVRQGTNRLQAAVINLQSTTPPLIQHLEALVEWAGLPTQNRAESSPASPG